MNQMTVFNYLSNTVRIVQINDQPWFVAADVCQALEMDTQAGTSQWLNRLAPSEKRRLGRSGHPELFSGSRASSLNIISESGLYKLIMRSDKPEARKFQDWVTREVLPAICKDGGYILGEEKVKTGDHRRQRLQSHHVQPGDRGIGQLSPRPTVNRLRSNALLIVVS